MRLTRMTTLALSVACIVNLQGQVPATIRFAREKEASKAIFDNTEYRLLTVDRFGNPSSVPVVSFGLSVTKNGDTRHFAAYGDKMSDEMLSWLKKQKKAVKMFFTEIQARDSQGHLIALPETNEIWFPSCPAVR
jgi:hypothetical protein